MSVFRVVFQILIVGGALLASELLMGQGTEKDPWTPLQLEIVQVERAFQQMTASQGIAYAFRYFAAPDAVLNRNNSLVRGREAIFEFYNKPSYQKAQVDWAPESITVSASGDLAQSYGSYTWMSADEDGTQKVSKGIFMTVWQRQPDGSWRYIWD